jgi:ribosomal protein L37AE/L43A
LFKFIEKLEKIILIKRKMKKVIAYKIIKFCRRCKKKFKVNKGESKIIYCDECYKIVRDQIKKEIEQEKIEEEEEKQKTNNKK